MKTYTIEEIEKVLGKEAAVKLQPKTIMDKVLTWEEAFAETGTRIDLPFSEATKDLIEISVNAYYILCIITKALNEEWEIDVKNKKQVVWVNWFDLRGLFSGGLAHYGAAAGFGYSLTTYAPSLATTYFGSRLCFRDQKTADYSRIHFNKIWLAYKAPEIMTNHDN